MASASKGWTMVASISAVAAMGLVAGLAGHGTAAASAKPSKAAVSVAGPGTSAEQVRDCVYGMSKDVCEGKLKGEQEFYTGCDNAPIHCRTYHLNDAKFDLVLNSSNLLCSTTRDSERGHCDEFGEETSGRFESRVNVILRQQEPCRFRGTIDGEAVYSMNNGKVFTGRLIGLIGSGADRAPACHTHVPIGTCENCLDIQFIDETDTPYWRFGTEIIFDGVEASGERVRLNISGSFTSPGGRDGPERLNAYKFVGTADGVDIFVCN